MTLTYIHDSMFFIGRTKEESAQSRQVILDAALTIFSQQGYETARLQNIAEAVGVTRGAIYHYFGGKRQMFVTLIDEVIEE